MTIIPLRKDHTITYYLSAGPCGRKLTQLKSEMYRWLKDYNVVYSTEMTGQSYSIKIDNGNHAMLFKLTWL